MQQSKTRKTTIHLQVLGQKPQQALGSTKLPTITDQYMPNPSVNTLRIDVAKTVDQTPTPWHFRSIGTRSSVSNQLPHQYQTACVNSISPSVLLILDLDQSCNTDNVQHSPPAITGNWLTATTCDYLWRIRT